MDDIVLEPYFLLVDRPLCGQQVIRCPIPRGSYFQLAGRRRGKPVPEQPLGLTMRLERLIALAKFLTLRYNTSKLYHLF